VFILILSRVFATVRVRETWKMTERENSLVSAAAAAAAAVCAATTTTTVDGILLYIILTVPTYNMIIITIIIITIRLRETRAPRRGRWVTDYFVLYVYIGR